MAGPSDLVIALLGLPDLVRASSVGLASGPLHS